MFFSYGHVDFSVRLLLGLIRFRAFTDKEEDRGQVASGAGKVAFVGFGAGVSLGHSGFLGGLGRRYPWHPRSGTR